MTARAKLIRIVLITAFVMCPLAVPTQAQPVQESLNQYLSDLKRNPGDTALREKIIKTVQAMASLPAIPEEARRHMNRGMAAAEDAKTEKDYRDAIEEFQKAINIAPWLGSGYRNLAIVQDKAGQYAHALQNLRLYLLTNPATADAEAARTMTDKIEYRKEKAARESSPEMIAAKKESEYKAWLQKLNGIRFVWAMADPHIGEVKYTIEIREKTAVHRGFLQGKYHEYEQSEIHNREFTQTGRPLTGSVRKGVISEDGSKITVTNPSGTPVIYYRE